MYLHVILAYDCHMSAFTLKKGRNGDLRYSLSPLIRIVCIVFAFLLVLGLISALGDGFGISYIFAALFTIILILVALYRDDWIFSNSSRTITVSYGIGPFSSKTEMLSIQTFITSWLLTYMGNQWDRCLQKLLKGNLQGHGEPRRVIEKPRLKWVIFF